MGLEEDVRQIRDMFQEHMKGEADLFTDNAREHGTILTKLEGIENRLSNGDGAFGTLGNRVLALEKQLTYWKGAGTVIAFVAGFTTQLIAFLVKQFWQDIIK